MSISLDRRTAVLVDQHPLWLDTVAQVVGRMNVEVVAKATSSASALALVEELRPDLLITGIKMGETEMDGITLIRQARERVGACGRSSSPCTTTRSTSTRLSARAPWRTS